MCGILVTLTKKKKNAKSVKIVLIRIFVTNIPVYLSSAVLVGFAKKKKIYNDNNNRSIKEIITVFTKIKKKSTA